MESNNILEGLLQDETITYTYQEFCEICVTDTSLIEEMREFGIIEMQGKEIKSARFTANNLIRAKKALRLHQDLSINWAGISLVLDLLEELGELRQLIAVSNLHKEN